MTIYSLTYSQDLEQVSRYSAVDLFVLHPILSTIDPPATARFPAGALPPGTPVTFHALDYESGLLVEVGAGTVDSTGRPQIETGGIPELTWVGVTETP